LASFADRVLPFVDELCLSLHGPDAATHDAATGRPGSFARLQAAFDNAERQSRGRFVFVNSVVTRLNAARLPDTLRLALSRGKVRHFLVSNLAPEGEGLRRYPELAVRHEEIARHLPGMAARAGGRGVDLRVFGVPLCALGARRALSNDLYYSPRVTVARARLEDGKVGWFEETALAPTRERVFLPACGTCADRGACGGVFRRYAEEFGAAGLSPRVDWEVHP
jgi:MoaA/NifB/PqqE/SkfB family radical SAM enzyme